ncbi:MAG: holin [Pseudobutyrivibrio sp.]|nr:holin [Pseudobutyrivibrio sp.]
MKNSLFHVNFKAWLKAAGIRAIKTFAQTCIALIPAAATIEAVDWNTVLSTAVLSAFVSLLTSMVGIPEVESEE